MESDSMLRKMIRAGVSALIGVIAVIATYGAAISADAAPDADIGEVMQKSFGKRGYKNAIASAVKSAKWEDAAKVAKEWNELAAELGKNKPPKGDQKAWETECKKFGDNTKAVLTATEKKDAKGVTAAMRFNCMGCHKAHKGQ
jgi:hypothetical protein